MQLDMWSPLSVEHLPCYILKLESKIKLLLLLFIYFYFFTTLLLSPANIHGQILYFDFTQDLHSYYYYYNYCGPFYFKLKIYGV